MLLDDRVQKTQITAEDWILGRPDAPVTLLEYGDFECPYCAMARPVLESLVMDHHDTIRLVYRHFPITTAHPHAMMAAEAAEAAGAQGKFWKMHDMLFTYQQNLEVEDLRRYAQEIGLDVVRFDRELKAHLHRDEVRLDFRRGIQDGVNGTPTIFINRLRYDGPRDRESILAAIAAQMPVWPTERSARVR
jgi:protein-disulfide isomerase